MSEWQPIETAPKDGTRVLIYEPSAVGGDIWLAGYYFGRWEASERASNLKPTHWMPAPEPPK